MSTIGCLLKGASERLKNAGIHDSRIDAELLITGMLDESRSYVFLHKNDQVDSDMEMRFEQMLEKRLSGMPVQYILESQEFMGMKFTVNNAVLIPRMDTEILVEWVLEKAERMDSELSIMDMCCGSGAIAVATAGFLPKIHITACDISEAALEIARRNAESNGTLSRSDFVRSDMFHILDDYAKFPGEPYDMILCNPPYIPTEVIFELQREVKDYEPLLALDGGVDGLNFYRIIAEDAAEYMKNEGLLFLEIGYDQAEAVSDLLAESGKYENIEIRKDLAGNDRVVCCTVRK